MAENNIPKHWQVKKLGEVCKLKNGFAFKSTDYKNEGVPVIRISDINKGFVSSEEAVRIKAKSEYENYLVENNDILVAMSGATTGKFGIYKSTEKAFQNQRVGKFKILDVSILDNKFLFHQINSLKRQIEKAAYGGAQPNISSSKIEEMQIVIPPLPEQQAIVSKIEELLSDLENGKQQLQTAQQKLKVYRQSLLKAAFEGKLSEEWRINQKSLITSAELLKKIQVEKEKIAKVSGKKSKPLTPISDNERAELPELPKQWIWVKLGDNAFVTKLAGFEFTKYVKYKDSGDIPVIRAQNVSRYSFIPRNFLYVDREIMVKLPRSRVFGGEILMVFVGAGLGNVGVVPNEQEFFLGPNVAKIALENQFTNKFIFHFLTSQMGFANVTGMSKATAQGSISMANIREVSVPLMSNQEQNHIVDLLETKLTICDKIEETISQSLQQAETLRQSILKKAFEGRFVQTPKG